MKDGDLDIVDLWYHISYFPRFLVLFVLLKYMYTAKYISSGVFIVHSHCCLRMGDQQIQELLIKLKKCHVKATVL